MFNLINHVSWLPYGQFNRVYKEKACQEFWIAFAHRQIIFCKLWLLRHNNGPSHFWKYTGKKNWMWFAFLLHFNKYILISISDANQSGAVTGAAVIVHEESHQGLEFRKSVVSWVQQSFTQTHILSAYWILTERFSFEPPFTDLEPCLLHDPFSSSWVRNCPATRLVSWMQALKANTNGKWNLPFFVSENTVLLEICFVDYETSPDFH